MKVNTCHFAYSVRFLVLPLKTKKIEIGLCGFLFLMPIKNRKPWVIVTPVWKLMILKRPGLNIRFRLIGELESS